MTKKKSVVPGLEITDEDAKRWVGAQVPQHHKTVRLSVDLDPEQHRALRMYAAQVGVRTSVIARALLTELLTDPDLAARVEARCEGR